MAMMATKEGRGVYHLTVRKEYDLWTLQMLTMMMIMMGVMMMMMIMMTKIMMFVTKEGRDVHHLTVRNLHLRRSRSTTRCIYNRHQHQHHHHHHHRGQYDHNCQD